MVRLVGRLYDWLVSRTTHRHYTYIMREWAHRHPRLAWLLGTVFVVGAVVGQTVAGRLLGLLAVPVTGSCAFLLVLCGHLYWDTPGDYIEP